MIVLLFILALIIVIAIIMDKGTFALQSGAVMFALAVFTLNYHMSDSLKILL